MCQSAGVEAAVEQGIATRGNADDEGTAGRGMCGEWALKPGLCLGIQGLLECDAAAEMLARSSWRQLHDEA